MSDKLQILKEKHELEEYELLTEDVKQKRKERTLFALGGIKAAEQIVASFVSAISSQTLRALEVFQKDRMYLDLGFDKFVDFLQDSEFSPMTKSQYYERKNLIDNEGDIVYDYLNSIGLSVSIRKLLASNDKEITIEGDFLVVGDEKLAIQESSSIKNILLEIANDNRKLKEENTKKQLKLEKAEQTINDGSKQVEQLRRQLDTNSEGSTFDRAQSRLINAFIKFNDELADVPLVERVDKDSVLDTLWTLLEESRKRFGSNKNFTVSGAAEMDIDPLLAQVMEDGFDDE